MEGDLVRVEDATLQTRLHLGSSTFSFGLVRSDVEYQTGRHRSLHASYHLPRRHRPVRTGGGATRHRRTDGRAAQLYGTSSLAMEATHVPLHPCAHYDGGNAVVQREYNECGRMRCQCAGCGSGRRLRRGMLLRVVVQSRTDIVCNRLNASTTFFHVSTVRDFFRMYEVQKTCYDM